MDINNPDSPEFEYCQCEFDPAAGEDSFHFKRQCAWCKRVWFSLHCRHDGVQNPCPGCGVRSIPVSEAMERAAAREVAEWNRILDSALLEQSLSTPSPVARR